MKSSRNVCSKMWTDVTIDLKTKTFKHCCKQVPYTPKKDELEELGKDFFLQYDLNKQNRKTMLFDDELPESCSFCKYQSGNAIKDVWNVWSEKYVAENISNLLETDCTTYIEIDIGNSCNLACIYCGPWSSTTWAKELGRPQSGGHENDYNHKVLSYLIQWMETFPKDREITINMLGGEPLMLPETYSIIEMLIPICKTFDVKPKMMVTTNLYTKPVLLSRLLKLLDETSDIFRWEFAISIEDVGNRAEMVRYHLNWEKFNENMDKIVDKVDYLYFTNTLNIISLPYFDEWIEWVFQKMADRKYGIKWALSCNYVQDNFTDSAYLSKDDVDFEKIRQTFLKLMESSGVSLELPKVKEFINHINNIEKRISSKKVSNEFVIFWKDITKRRGVDYINSNPALKKLIENYENDKII